MLGWLARDLDLVSVLLRALVFAFESLSLGGLAFLLMVLVPVAPGGQLMLRCRRTVGRAALGLAAAQAAASAVSAAMLAGVGLPFSAMLAIPSFEAGAMVTVAALLLAVCVQTPTRLASLASGLMGLPILGGALAMSHAAARMDHRATLAFFTLLHHLGSAGWLGAMAFLLLTLRVADAGPSQRRIAQRYSALALASVALLLAGGVGMSWFYVGSWAASYGTVYGLLLWVKAILTCAMLVLGAGNFLLLRAPAVFGALLLRLRRAGEAEIGLGFTILLAAASLTAQSPAMDVPGPDRSAAHAIVERLRWVAPRLSSPEAASLTPPATTMRQAVDSGMYSASVSDKTDRAWSEYNHHMAGLAVLAAALLALVHRGAPAGSRVETLARGWPLVFLGLAAFILLRADPEAWPLGPRGFWESFAEPDVLEHRLEVLLLCGFTLFEWAVRTGRVRSARAAYVFPLACAGGGALLLTHSHGMGDAREELLLGLSHAAVAVLGIFAGWSRWLELRAGGRIGRFAAWTWPLCLVLAGMVLLDYRES